MPTSVWGLWNYTELMTLWATEELANIEKARIIAKYKAEDKEYGFEDNDDYSYLTVCEIPVLTAPKELEGESNGNYDSKRAAR